MKGCDKESAACNQIFLKEIAAFKKVEENNEKLERGAMRESEKESKIDYAKFLKEKSEMEKLAMKNLKANEVRIEKQQKELEKQEKIRNRQIQIDEKKRKADADRSANNGGAKRVKTPPISRCANPLCSIVKGPLDVWTTCSKKVCKLLFCIKEECVAVKDNHERICM